MTRSAAREQFEAFLAHVEENLTDRADVIGLVGMGSTAERDRVDEWSDHDLAVVTDEGRQQDLRRAASWLPHPDRIALEVHEHHGGAKVVYDDGHVVEYGVASLDDLSGWSANAYDVRLDRGGVAVTMAAVASKPVPIEPDVDRDLGLMLALVLIGVGRARRGEGLSAGTLVRGAAVDALTRAVAARRRPERPVGLDSLDPTRRFDAAYPSLAPRIEILLAGPVEPCARGLVDLAVEIFGIGVDGVPARGLDAVRHRLGWESTNPAC